MSRFRCRPKLLKIGRGRLAHRSTRAALMGYQVIIKECPFIMRKSRSLLNFPKIGRERLTCQRAQAAPIRYRVIREG